jgi:hypothetical protein
MEVIMTTASHPWKQALTRRAAVLKTFSGPHRISGASAVKLEEAVVVGCYDIRRLINGFLLSESLVHQSFPMTAFPHRQQTSPMLGDEPLPVRYDLNNGRRVQHDLMFLCHQVLQNCVFEPWLGAERSLQGIYVTSDHQRKVALYGVRLDALCDLFLRLGEDTRVSSSRS